jgi:uncharacterized protein (TIGR03067 family)
MNRFVLMPCLATAAFFLIVSGPGGSFSAAARDGGDERELEEKELAALQGTWECRRWEQEGKLMPTKDTRSANTRVVIDGRKAVFQAEGYETREGTINVDVTKTPRHLNFSTGGLTIRCLYVRAGDHVIMCMGFGDRERPTEFVTGSAKGGASLYVWEIRR